ncbi:MAG: PAS domain S-box protein [Rubrobacteraceae bacterium]
MEYRPESVEEQGAGPRLRLFESILGNTNDAVVVTEANFLDEPGPRIVYANEAFLGMTGYGAEEVLGKSPRLLQGPETERAELDRIREALEKGDPVRVELLNYRKDGSTFWVDISFVPIRDDSGGITNWAAVQRETTERREKERRLREMLVRYGSDMVTILEPDGTPRYESESIERVLGYRHKDVVGKDFFRFVHPEDTVRLAEANRQTMVTPGLNPPVEFRIRHADGSWVYFESIANNLIDDPDVNGVVVNSRDITRRKQAETKLQETEARYRALVEEVPAIIYIQEPRPGESASYDVSYMSPRVEEVLGYPAERFIEDPYFWNGIIHPDDQERHVAEDERTDETGEPFSMEYRMIAQDGRVVWIRDEAVLYYGPRDEPIYWQGIMTDVTVRRQAEEDFKESEDRFRSVVQNSSEIVKIVDLDGTLMYASPAFERILGYDPEESIGMNVLDYVHPDDLSKVLEETQCALEKPGLARNTVEYRFRHADGHWKYLESAGVYLMDEPSIRGVLITQRDVTDARRAEEILHQSEERFRGAFENASTGVALVGLDRRLLKANRSLCEMLGYSEEELLTKRTSDLTHPDDQEPSRQRTERLLSGESSGQHRLEKRYVRKDGRAVCIISDVSVVRDSGGEPSHFVSQFLDITDRKSAEEKLRESEERYRKLAENSPDAILVHQDGEIAFINAAGARMIGADDPEELVGKTTTEFVHPDYREIMNERTARVQADGEPLELVEMKFLRLDGGIVDGEARAISTSYRGRPAIQSMIRDITKRKLAEDALRESEERYRRQARELDLLHQARTAVAHDLDLDAVFYTIVEATARVYGYRLVSAYLLRDGELVLQHQVGHERAIERISMYEGVSGRVARTGHPVFLEDVSTDPDFLGAFEGTVSEVCVPLLDGGEVVGILNVESTGTKLTDHDLELVDALGEHVGMAVNRARLYAQMRDAERRYRSLVEQIPAVIYTDDVDESNSALYRSPYVEEILGYKPEDFLSDPYFWQDLLHKDDRERVLAENDRTNETGEPFRIEYRMIGKDGRVVWVRDEAILIRDEEDRPLYWQGVFTDVTERRKTEEALRESSEKYRSVVESVKEVIFRTDAEGLYTFLNPAWTEVTGFKVEESLGESYLKFIHPSDLDRNIKDFEFMGEHGEGYSKYEARFTTRDGGMKWIEVSFQEHFDDEGNLVGTSGTLDDVTERKALEEKLEYQAYHDALTGLPNRTMFNDRVSHALDLGLRQGARVAILFLDLDDFKVVNDSMGHEMGDRLLAEVAERLRICLRPEDTICRLGGDEFAILLEDSDLAGATWVAQRVSGALREPFHLGARQEIFVTTSVGIVLGDNSPGGSSRDIANELIRKADMAMYRAKRGGKAGYAVFELSMDERAAARLSLESDLRRAVEKEEFQLSYQPIVSISTGEVVGAEALLRWRHPERGLIPPDDFIPVAEETGLIVQIGKWVLRESSRRAREWREGYDSSCQRPMLYVNLSGLQLRYPNLGRDVARILEDADLEPGALTLEITESVAMEDAESTALRLRELKDLGLKLAIDDFGTGYSSLSYLRDFPVDCLKIDYSFIKGLGRNKGDYTIAAGIIGFAHGLGLGAVAEGVETEEQLEQLRRLGCDMAQGNMLWEPLSTEESLKLFTGRSSEG